MQLIDKDIRRKKIKLTDEQIYDLVKLDKDEAEKYFTSYLLDRIIMRYELLNGSDEYYAKRFPKLHDKCSFTSSDIKDVVEWLMPSFTEVFFGADKVVGIFGRSPDDDPEVLEKIIQYQMQTQNNGYVILDQWIRDALESGLGVVRMEWEHREKKVLNQYIATAEEFYMMSPEDSKKVRKVEPLADGTYLLTVKEIETVKDQVVLNNVKPGEYLYLPDQNEDGHMVFEMHRRKMLFDDLQKLAKLGIYRNLDDFEFDADYMDSDTMGMIDDAIRNYSGEKDRETNDYLDASSGEGQESRKLVTVYDCWGQYDVDGDGLLEPVHVVMCNNRILLAEVNEDERSPFFHLSFYANSYQTWKTAVADFLQDIQDMKTAIMKQIIINTTLNNDRAFAVDTSQTKAVSDLEAGKKIIRVDLSLNRNITDVVQPMVKYELPKEAFTLLEMANTQSEQKTGITKYNQGLDANSLNKTATGISRIMEASQQRMRKMARDGAENGIVPLYKHLIKLDKAHLNQEFVFRLQNQYYEFAPDDIDGEFDVQVTSNIGLQDKQLTIQNLMLMFTQILPTLMQMGAATPVGMHETATQIIEEMGFTSPDKYIGVEAGMATAQATANQLVSQIPQIMMQLGQQFGLSPEQAGQLSNALAQFIQQTIQQQAQQQQPMMPAGTNPNPMAAQQTPQQTQSANQIKQNQPDGRMMM